MPGPLGDHAIDLLLEHRLGRVRHAEFVVVLIRRDTRIARERVYPRVRKTRRAASTRSALEKKNVRSLIGRIAR